jgi:hypothetical protein
MTNNAEADNVDLSMDETLLDIRELPSARVSGSGGRIRPSACRRLTNADA